MSAQEDFFQYVMCVVGHNLRRRRAELKLTQVQVSDRLAARLGRAHMYESYYRGVESGGKEVSLRRLLIIGDVLGIAPEDLFVRAKSTIE